MKLEQIVSRFIATQTKPSCVLQEQRKILKEIELDQTYYTARCEACYQAQGGCFATECLMYPRSCGVFEDHQAIIKVFKRAIRRLGT
jgi:hypothetical protein